LEYEVSPPENKTVQIKNRSIDEKKHVKRLSKATAMNIITQLSWI